MCGPTGTRNRPPGTHVQEHRGRFPAIASARARAPPPIFRHGRHSCADAVADPMTRPRTRARGAAQVVSRSPSMQPADDTVRDTAHVHGTAPPQGFGHGLHERACGVADSGRSRCRAGSPGFPSPAEGWSGMGGGQTEPCRAVPTRATPASEVRRCRVLLGAGRVRNAEEAPVHGCGSCPTACCGRGTVTRLHRLLRRGRTAQVRRGNALPTLPRGHDRHPAEARCQQHQAAGSGTAGIGGNGGP